MNVFAKNRFRATRWHQKKGYMTAFAARSKCVGEAFATAMCVSVTMYCAKTTEFIIMLHSPNCSPAILVFPH